MVMRSAPVAFLLVIVDGAPRRPGEGSVLLDEDAAQQLPKRGEGNRLPPMLNLLIVADAALADMLPCLLTSAVVMVGAFHS